MVLKKAPAVSFIKCDLSVQILFMVIAAVTGVFQFMPCWLCGVCGIYAMLVMWGVWDLCHVGYVGCVGFMPCWLCGVCGIYAMLVMWGVWDLCHVGYVGCVGFMPCWLCGSLRCGVCCVSGCPIYGSERTLPVLCPQRNVLSAVWGHEKTSGRLSQLSSWPIAFLKTHTQTHTHTHTHICIMAW